MIEPLSLEEWIRFDDEHPAPTFFSRPAWALALADVHAHMSPAPLRIRIAPHRVLIVPMMRLRGGTLRWKEFSSFPLGGYTCFLHEDGTPASAVECDRVVAQLRRFADAATIVPWPLAAAPSRCAGAAHETSVIDLRDGIDRALAGASGIFRRMAGQAARRGVVCTPDTGPDAVDRYYELLEDSAKRWGLEKPSISKAFITALRERGGTNVEIWFARAENRAVAGGIVFYGSKELFFWSAAMLAEFGRLRPSNALNFALIRAAVDRGMEWYNLGASEGLPGVARFKQEIGAVGLTYHDIRVERAPYRLYSRLRTLWPQRALA